MKTLPARIAATLLGAAFIVPALAQQAARGPDVLAQPDFLEATQGLSGEDRMELAAHLNLAVLRQHELAIPMYEALLARSPNRADLWAALAVAYNHASEPQEALDAARIAITLAPHVPYFRAERGIAEYLLGRSERAVEDLEHSLRAFPVNARAYYYLGLAQATAGKIDAARASLTRARALNPALAIMTDYYLGLIAAGRGQIAMSRELLARTQEAVAGSDLPVTRLVAEQLQQVDGAVSRRMRAAMHESDARLAALPGAPAGR